MTERVIILGSGPAGYTAAIYCARAELKPLIIEGLQSGGQLTITTIVENYPGFPNGIDGTELMLAMRAQTEAFGARIESGSATKVDLSNRPFKIFLEDKTLECESLIVATGAVARWLGLESETKLRGKGVSACATCDGFFFKNQDVIVVGGGDTALEEAVYLTHFAKTVTVVHRRDELRATASMQARAKAHPQISFLWNSVVEEIKDISKGKVTSVVLKNVKDGTKSTRACDGVFVAIGHSPNTSIFAGQLELDKDGYIITEPGTSFTNIDGVFAAGDVCDPNYRQAVTAAGMGCIAAIDVDRWLQGK